MLALCRVALLGVMVDDATNSEDQGLLVVGWII